MKRQATKPNDCQIWYDEDVAAFLGINLQTFQRRVAKPAKGEINPNDAHHCTIGGRRLWIRADVERLVGIGEPRKDNRR